MLTLLFAITDGISWEQALNPLREACRPRLGAVCKASYVVCLRLLSVPLKGSFKGSFKGFLKKVPSRALEGFL